MPRAARAEVFDPAEVCVVHAVQRCVRRAFLAGCDAVSGRDFDHRREWIRRRLEVLASVFGIDVLNYAILSNHMHLVLRTRPDVVATWSDREVAERWLRLFPGRRLDEYLGQPTENDIESLAADTKSLKNIRIRLTDITWFMRSVSEPIARMANREDDCTGRFWEGRFKAQRITDEAGLLACSMYVDLNPIRAGVAKSPETSGYTSAFDRIKGFKGEEIASAVAAKPLTQAEAAAEIKTTSIADRKKKIVARKRQTGKRILRDAWLAPLTINERERSTPKPSRSGVRASDKGFLSMALTDYIKLLDWTGRQGRKDKRGKVPAQLAPILSRLGIDSGMWCDLVWNFKKYFGRNAGSPASLKEAAADSGRHWSRGQRAAQACFSDG
ncbi:MAG: hypothetical protein ABL888_15365 [Pirellulaceae bacterium]